MMKTRTIILVCLVLATLRSFGQEWIGHRFTLDTIVGLQCAHKPGNLNLVKCHLVDNTFYFVEQQSFQKKENDYQAVIHAIRLDNYEQTEILLPLPHDTHNRDRYARNLWIYDFCFDGDYLLVTTQEELILYKQIQNQNYQVVSTYRHDNLFMGYLYQNSIHFFEEDHDKGFKWFQQRLGSDSATLVRELPYEAPHIVQIQPNRYISHNQQSVFFLSTRFPRLEVYSLDGQLTEEITFDLPCWKAFDDEYIRRTLSTPYGIERIYAVKDDIYDYSYPKVIMPLDGDLLLLYTQYDTIIGKSVLQYAIREDNGKTIRYLRNNHEDSTYIAAQFPFTLFQGGFDKGNDADKGLIVHLTYQTDVSWKGKTTKKYYEDVNRYFEEKDPILAYKIMRYSPKEASQDIHLHTISGRQIALSELPEEKCILLLHSGLECSGCIKAIYGLFNQTLSDSIHIGHVYSKQIENMAAFELRIQIRQELHRPFSLYYDTSKNHKALSPSLSLREPDYPCVILYRRGYRIEVFKADELFEPGFGSTSFHPKFLNAWRSFISK